jgi:hypothetical protein
MHGMNDTSTPVRAAIAMWWDMAPEWRVEFEHWHSHEHFPERLAIPGFLQGSRWQAVDGGPGFFVLYELDDYATLTSPHYLERLNHPTPWSTQLMPHHRNMVRSQCHVLEACGAGVARYALTLRLSPASGEDDRLRAGLAAQVRAVASAAGTTAAKLLRTDTPALDLTTEQRIRGGRDGAADWIVVASGYDLAALQGLRAGELSDETLLREGAADSIQAGLYSLSHAGR